MAREKIYFEKGTAYNIIDGKRSPVDSIAGQSPCDCELDCCLQAIRLKDHDGTGIKYIYIFEGAIKVDTLAQLKIDSTIL